MSVRKKLSLIKRLNNYIQSVDYITWDTMEKYVKQINEIEGKHYKIRTAERSLNHSFSPNVETIYNSKGCIVGYKYRKN